MGTSLGSLNDALHGTSGGGTTRARNIGIAIIAIQVAVCVALLVTISVFVRRALQRQEARVAQPVYDVQVVLQSDMTPLPSHITNSSPIPPTPSLSVESRSASPPPSLTL